MRKGSVKENGSLCDIPLVGVRQRIRDMEGMATMIAAVMLARRSPSKPPVYKFCIVLLNALCQFEK